MQDGPYGDMGYLYICIIMASLLVEITAVVFGCSFEHAFPDVNTNIKWNE